MSLLYFCRVFRGVLREDYAADLKVCDVGPVFREIEVIVAVGLRMRFGRCGDSCLCVGGRRGPSC